MPASKRTRCAKKPCADDQRLAPHSVDDWRLIINDIFVAQDYTKGCQAAEGLDFRWQRAKRVAQ
jgi:hypothetical protein